MDGDLALASWHGFSGGLRVRFLNDLVFPPAGNPVVS
jgi:hypothetical protein